MCPSDPVGRFAFCPRKITLYKNVNDRLRNKPKLIIIMLYHVMTTACFFILPYAPPQSL